MNSDNNGRGFAEALSNAGAKPTRKPTARKSSEDGTAGTPLPGVGNQMPPAPAMGTSAAGTSAVAADGGATGAGPAAVGAAAPGSSGAAGTAAAAEPQMGGNGGTVKGAASGDEVGGTPGEAKPTATLVQLMALPATDAADASADSSIPEVPLPGAAGAAGGANAAAKAGNDADTGAAKGNLVAIGVDGAKAPPTVPSARAPKPIDAGARATDKTRPSTANADAAINADTGTAGTSGPAAASNSDSTAQMAAMSAMAAAAGAAAPVDSAVDADSTLSSTAQPGAPGAAGKKTDAAGAGVAPGLAAAAGAPARQAAADAANVKTVSALDDGSAADKHSRGANADSSLPGTSGDGTAGLAQMSSTGTAGVDAAPAPLLKVAAGVDTPEFGQSLADRVSWMVDNNLNGARLQVNPPQLGPIEVRIAVQGGHAQVWMTSHSAVTRDALESSSPKLREMLGAQGFGQVSVDISQRSFQERTPQAPSYDRMATDRSAYSAPVGSVGASLPRASSGILDAYA